MHLKGKHNCKCDKTLEAEQLNLWIKNISATQVVI